MPLYIEIDNPDLALRKAMESGDSDLSTIENSFLAHLRFEPFRKDLLNLLKILLKFFFNLNASR